MVEDNVQEVVDALAEVTGNKNVTHEVSAVAKTLENVVDVASPSVEVWNLQPCHVWATVVWSSLFLVILHVWILNVELEKHVLFKYFTVL